MSETLVEKFQGSLVDLLALRARQHATKSVFTFVQRPSVHGTKAHVTLSYGDLDDRARAVAERLSRMDSVGKRILIMFPGGVEAVISFFGCLYSGAIAVPVFPPNNAASLAKLQLIVQDSGAQIVLTTSAIRQSLREQVSSHPAALQALGRVEWLTVDWNEEVSENEKGNRRRKTDGMSGSHSDGNELARVFADSIAFLQYTSGSTGSPKGVMLTHANLIANLEMIQQSTRSTADDTLISWLPLQHDMGLIGGVLHTIFSAMHTYLLPPTTMARPLKWLEAISEFRGTVTSAPNFAYELCVAKINAEDVARLDLSSLRIALNGAEPIRASTFTRFIEHFRAAKLSEDIFFPCYGLAEASLIVAGRDLDRKVVVRTVDKKSLLDGHVEFVAAQAGDAQSLASSGKLCAGVKLSIRNPNSRAKCGPTEVGEIWVSGANIAKGYFNKIGQTRETFVIDDNGERFLRTGDLGFMDSDGELYVTGRIKDLIVIRGKNYAPHDIEHVAHMTRTPIRLKASAAFSIDIDGAERVVLMQEIDGRATESELSHTRSLIIDRVSCELGITLSEVCLVARGSVLRTSSGKIRRQDMKKTFLSTQYRSAVLTTHSPRAS